MEWSAGPWEQCRGKATSQKVRDASRLQRCWPDRHDGRSSQLPRGEMGVHLIDGHSVNLLCHLLQRPRPADAEKVVHEGGGARWRRFALHHLAALESDHRALEL